jgi:hypothetical protein
VVGGKTGVGPHGHDSVELISLDPENNPVPERFKKMKKFPFKIPGAYGGGSGAVRGTFPFKIYCSSVQWLHILLPEKGFTLT